jgi:serine/threonine-protein phosphatase 2A activator
MGVVPAEQIEWMTLKIFPDYLIFMRYIQRRYMLEPAGTHGVWSLDDYQFLPFYFGAAQLIGNPHDILPSRVLDAHVREEHAADYMFIAAIDFIFQMKTGPFFEHSPILYDTTGVSSWNKINSGMLKMYKGEVLGKFPIMQHFLFGSCLAADSWFSDAAPTGVHPGLLGSIDGGGPPPGPGGLRMPPPARNQWGAPPPRK